jgi:hypothetical protein
MRRQRRTWREVARHLANMRLILWAAVVAVGVLLLLSAVR